MPKYTTYKQLSEAFRSGELGEHYYLMLDKSGCCNSLNYYDKNATADENEKRQEACTMIFDFDDSDGSIPIESACDALGIRYEWS